MFQRYLIFTIDEMNISYPIGQDVHAWPHAGVEGSPARPWLSAAQVSTTWTFEYVYLESVYLLLGHKNAELSCFDEVISHL